MKSLNQEYILIVYTHMWILQTSRRGFPIGGILKASEITLEIKVQGKERFLYHRKDQNQKNFDLQAIKPKV